MKLRQIPVVKQPTVLPLSKPFLYDPLPKSLRLTCYLVKQPNSSIYHLLHEKQLLLAAKKRSARASTEYLLSMSGDNLTTRDKNYLGFVKANFFGTEWHVFDAGEEKSKDVNEIRKHLAFLEYEFNIFGLSGPRKMEVTLPAMSPTTRKPFCVRAQSMSHPLKSLKEDNDGRLISLINKSPTYNEKMKVFILDFRGKVKEPSVKNFILVDKETKTECLLFGKQSEEKFVLEVSYPLGLVQAMGIALSSISRKIMVE